MNNCVLSFHCDSQGFYLTMQNEARRRHTTHFHISLRLSSQTKDYFLAASHAGIALQGLPRLKAKDVDDVRSLCLCFFLALDNVYNLALSFNFSITNGQISVACRNLAALNLSHTAHFEKRSPEQSVMCTDLDLYYK